MGTYRFYIAFKDDDITIEIAEPFQFSSFSHGVERDMKGFAVDTRLFSENTDLYFSNAEFERTEQYEDIDGVVMFNLGHGLKRLLDAFNEYGADANIELQIHFNGSLITKCDFDLEDVDTDMVTFFKCGFIENSLRSKFKQREDDVTINIFAEEDLDGNAIPKMETLKVLLPSKPKLKNSKWIKTDIPFASGPNNSTYAFPAGGPYIYFNFCKNPIIYGIDDTLIPSPLEEISEYNDTYNGNMKMIDAKSTKSNLKFKIECDVSYKHRQNGTSGYANKSSLALYLRFSSGPTAGESELVLLHKKEFVGHATQEYTFPPVIEYEYPGILDEGNFVTLYWHFYWDMGTMADNPSYQNIKNWTHVDFRDCTVEASTIETGISSIVQGGRWIDVVSKAAEIVNGMPVDAPKLSLGGEYYETLVTNGGGIRNISEIPFEIKVKDIFEAGQMVALDYQLTDDDIKIAEYSEFFSDRLLRSFNVKPDNEFMWNVNREYRNKTFKYEFEKYEQDREESSTLDAVHTEIELLLPNRKPMNVKHIKVKQILDDYKIDSLRRLGIDPQTMDSSLVNDTDLVFLSLAALDPNHKEEYTGMMNISTYPGGIKIYSNLYRWDKIGLGLTGTFEITNGANTGQYSIVGIESNLLTLVTLTPTTVNKSESKVVGIRYSLPGVFHRARTSEGFSVVNGLISPNGTYNLAYTKVRNIKRWLPYLATCTMRYPESAITVSFMKSNQDLETKLLTELNSIVEKDDISVASISKLKRVTDKTFKVDVFVDDPTDITDMFTELNVRNADGSIGGYYEFRGIRNEVIKGYPVKLEYMPLENKIEAECMEKYDIGDGVVDFINAERNLYSQFRMNGIYVTVMKVDGSELFSSKRFNKILINGVKYFDEDIFINDFQEFFDL